MPSAMESDTSRFLVVRDVADLMANSLEDDEDDGEAQGEPARRPPSARCVGLEKRGESGDGENYGSTFLKLDVHYEDTKDGAGAFTVPAVGKLLPATEFLRNVFNTDVSFPKEVNFYRNVVPAMRALQRELRLPASERIQVFPKLLGARIGASEDRVDDEAILVLEDLSASGYRCGNRHRGMDMEHCRLAIRELARFHALGIALKKLRPDVFWGPVKQACISYLHNKTPEEADEVVTRLQRSNVDLVVQAMPEVADVLDTERLRRAVLTGFRPPGEAIEPFCTVCHEDYWVNNMMFAYDADGAPHRVKMVDFQLTGIDSPARDLLFFIFSSAESSVLAEFDALLKEYHAELKRYVGLHGVDTSDLDWDAFQKEVEREAPAEFGHLSFMVIPIRAETKVAKTDSNSDEVFTSMLGVSDRARTRYMELLSFWLKRGWLKASD